MCVCANGGNADCLCMCVCVSSCVCVLCVCVYVCGCKGRNAHGDQWTEKWNEEHGKKTAEKFGRNAYEHTHTQLHNT